MTECSIEIWEQPAKKVKFRMEVHGHRCQSKELLVGRNSTDEGRIFPLIKVTCGGQGGRIRDSIRRDLHVRMSLVDVRSSECGVVEHYHKLVDCNTRCQDKNRSIVKKLVGNDDRVEFDNLGIVKTLEKDKEEEVTERMTLRRKEAGDVLGAWVKQDIKDKATSQAKETSPYRLKLMFEAFLYDESGVVVKVAPDVFSDEIVDLTNTTTGELAVRKMNRAADTVMGRQEMMMFTGGGKPECKVNHARSIFQAEFFELDPQDLDEERKVWSTVVDIRDDELHTVGQFLGGVHFLVPPYKDQDIAMPTQNVYCQLIKRNKAKTDQIQAKSDPLSFTYTPLVRTLQYKSLKRPMEQQILRSYEREYRSPPEVVSFQAVFNPEAPHNFNSETPHKTPKLGPTIQDLVHPIKNSSLRQTIDEIKLSPHYDPAPASPFSPSQLGQMSLGSPNPTQNATANCLGSPNPPQSSNSSLNIPVISLVPSTPPSNHFSPNQSSGSFSLHSSQRTLMISSPSTTPGNPSTMYMAQPGTSPSASVNDSSSPFMSMNHSFPNTIMVDPHGLGNEQSSTGNSSGMESLWNAQPPSQQILVNLGPDLGHINFDELLKDAPDQHSAGGIQSDSEKFEDIFVHEIIATDSVSKLKNHKNNTDTNEIKENHIESESFKKSKDKIDDNDNDCKDDQHEKDLSECIATLTLK